MNQRRIAAARTAIHSLSTGSPQGPVDVDGDDQVPPVHRIPPAAERAPGGPRPRAGDVPALHAVDAIRRGADLGGVRGPGVGHDRYTTRPPASASASTISSASARR